MTKGPVGGALPRAIDMEIAKRTRRLDQITPKIRALLKESKELKAQVEQLEALKAQWGGGMPAATPKIDHTPARQDSPVTDQRMQDIVDCLREHSSLSPKDMCEELRWPRPQLVEPLRRLVDAGQVVGVGATNDRRYSLAQVPA